MSFHVVPLRGDWTTLWLVGYAPVPAALPACGFFGVVRRSLDVVVSSWRMVVLPPAPGVIPHFVCRLTATQTVQAATAPVCRDSLQAYGFFGVIGQLHTKCLSDDVLGWLCVGVRPPRLYRRRRPLGCRRARPLSSGLTPYLRPDQHGKPSDSQNSLLQFHNRYASKSVNVEHSCLRPVQ